MISSSFITIVVNIIIMIIIANRPRWTSPATDNHAAAVAGLPARQLRYPCSDEHTAILCVAGHTVSYVCPGGMHHRATCATSEVPWPEELTGRYSHVVSDSGL